MSGDNTPHDLARLIRRLEHRIRDLETGQQARRTGQEDGAYVVEDENENERLTIGVFEHPYSNPVNQDDFGILQKDAAGAVTFLVDSGGATIPGDRGFVQEAANSSSGTPSVTVTSTSFTETWSVWFLGRLGAVVSISSLIDVPSGVTAAQAQLRTSGLDGGDITSDPITLTPNSVTEYIWHWNPGGSIDPNDVYAVIIDVKVVTGSGTITAYKPRWYVQRSAIAVDTNVTNP